MAKRKSMFIQTQTNMVSLSVKVPQSTKARADALVAQLKNVDPSLSFNTSKILQDAYEEAITAAEQELAELKKQGQGNRRSRPAPDADRVDARA